MFGIANEAWKKEQNMNILQSNKRYLILSGDVRFSSLVNNTKYLNYSLCNQDLKTILAISTSNTGWGCSNRMEKSGLVKLLEEVKRKQLKIKSLSTGSHCQIKKYMREEEEDINHHFDVSSIQLGSIRIFWLKNDTWKFKKHFWIILIFHARFLTKLS